MIQLLTRRALADPVAAALADLVDPLTARVREPELVELAREVDPRQPARALAAAGARLAATLAAQAEVRERADRLRAAALGTDSAARPELVIEHLRTTGRTTAQLRADLGAVTRGQLDIACLMEREAGEIEALGTKVEVVLRLLPGLVAAAAEADPAGTRAALADLLAEVATVATDEPRRPTRLAAIEVLGLLVAGHGLAWGLASPGLTLLERLAHEPGQGPWVRRAALRAARALPPEPAATLLGPALGTTEGVDAHLVRAQAIELALVRPEWPADQVVAAAGEDDSELVRFTLADGLAGRVGAGLPGADDAVAALLARAEPRTRARLAWALGSAGPAIPAWLARLVGDEELVARVALAAVTRALRAGHSAPPALVEAVLGLPEDAPIGLVRAAALVRHLLLAAASPARELAAQLATLRLGDQVEVRLPAGVDPIELARCLVPAAERGHGFVLAPAGTMEETGGLVRVSRGEQAAPAAWRVLHEARNPAPAKRQAYTHATGRADLGPLRVPPGRLAEATPTGVPGQRVYLDRQEGWAPEVPLVDDLTGALSHGRVLLVSALGTTIVRAPPARRRLATRLRLAWRYAELDRLRSASLDSEDEAVVAAWDRAVAGLGFEVERRPPPRPTAWLDPLTFGVSLSGSTLGHLGVVLALLAVLLFGRLSWARHRLRRARAAVPLVIGGWGTRGKSGTERLKAGLFQALGVPVLSKTTGCEAMVLHAPPGGRARELFLYRPYDKATIWEQADVALLGEALGARVLLWECMALNPRYVELLQSWWMHDDLSTLTNAFPDHEDIQGPTGEDVATVIAGFAPLGRPVLTTEEGMLPVMEEVAAERGATVLPVPSPEHQLLPRDLLSRFRHSEHPANVALVAAMAEGLGIPRVEAVSWMAEHVVADVGALVLHAPVPTEGRIVTFAQGQSANDPLSFRHSWRTAGFETPCPVHEWRVTVVNNRADRVARSRMFAGLLADRASAHRHVLIGTNLQGLRTYLAEAVDARLARTDLASEASTSRLFAHLRLPAPGPLADVLGSRLGVPEAARAAFQQALAELPPPAEPTWTAAQAAARSLLPAARRLAEALPQEHAAHGADLAEHLVVATARHLAQAAALAGGPPERAALYRELVSASLVVVADAKATGDQIIATVVRSAPPGTHVRLIGLQNIKGTGLDFAYRWVEWGVLHPLLADLPGAGPEQRARILGMLGTRDYGSVMACDGVLAALTGPNDSALAAARAHVEARRATLIKARLADADQGGPWRALLGTVERMLDPFHGMLRRRRARAVLEALADQRISHDRAQTELQRLTDQQKGGWLVKGR